ncbi:MAG: amidohydrolase family protein [Gammaproteobacteria bacterium]|nr:amidohydrolase family protein [Gammaproteobacteria bacterium]
MKPEPGSAYRLAIVAALATGLTPTLPGTLEAQGGPPEQDSASARTIFDGTTVIDGTGASARTGMAIVVEGEGITAVVPAAELGEEEREGAEVIDASGWFAIPGLVESHTHVATVANRARAEFILNRQLYAGITTARDMAGDVRSLMDLQRASLVKEIDAPDLHFSALVAGPDFFTDPRTVSSAAGESPGEVSWMQAVTGDTDLAQAVALARGTWATGIKTYAAIDGELLAAIAAEAGRQGIPVWSHTHVGPARALEVAGTGVRSMSHVCSVGSAAIPEDVFREGQEGRRTGFVDVDLNHPAVDSVFALMRRNGTVLDATIRVVVQVGLRRMAAIDTVNVPPPGETADSTGARPGPRRPPIDRRRRGVRAQCETADAVALTRRAWQAGVMVATGTDGMTPPASDFPALFDEIRHLHDDVGMPMLDVLEAASHHGAVALGLEDSIGTIEPGKHANIVFLRDDPLAGPESLRSVELTVKRGTRYYRRDFVLGAPPAPPGPPGR